MSYLDIIDICASGLAASRIRMDTIAQNIANAETTQTPEGGPYRRKLVILRQHSLADDGSLFPGPLLDQVMAGPNRSDRATRSLLTMLGSTSAKPVGVEVAEIRPDDGPLPRVYDPSHPHADADGYVELPNVQLPLELADLIAARQAYEANSTVLEVIGKSINDTINLLS